MNTSLDLEQLITEGIKGLSPQYLSEVADFVVFINAFYAINCRAIAACRKDTFNFLMLYIEADAARGYLNCKPEPVHRAENPRQRA